MDQTSVRVNYSPMQQWYWSTLCSLPLEPLKDAFLAKDVVACSSHWTPEDPLAYGADQVVVWGVHKQLHIVAPALWWHLWVCLNVWVIIVCVLLCFQIRDATAEETDRPWESQQFSLQLCETWTHSCLQLTHSVFYNKDRRQQKRIVLESHMTDHMITISRCNQSDKTHNVCMFLNAYKHITAITVWSY